MALNEAKSATPEIEVVIINVIANYYHIPVELVLSIDQHGNYTKARHIAMYFIKKMTKDSLKKTGLYFEGRRSEKHHATVVQALKSVSNQIETNEQYAKEVEEIEKKLCNLNPVKKYREFNSQVFQENDFYLN